MKKIAPLVILFLFAMVAWNVFGSQHGMVVDIDGESFDGPLGAMLGALITGGGLVIGAIVILFVGLVLAVVMAGVGVVLAVALTLVALIGTALVSPLLLPLMLPLAAVWFLMKRDRKNRTPSQAA